MVKAEKKHLIYSNMKSDSNCDPSECSQKQHQGYCDCDEVSLSDERMNLSRQLDGRVVAIAKLGLWNGTRQGYKVLGTNLNSIFGLMEDYNEFYSDGKNVLARQIHHDGTNHIMFRELRPDRSHESLEKFLQEIYDGVELTPQKLSAYTRSLHPYVAKVYGW